MFVHDSTNGLSPRLFSSVSVQISAGHQGVEIPEAHGDIQDQVEGERAVSK
jgi:hypothetical protein